VLHYDALQIGFAFLPATVVMGVLSLRFSERLIMRFGPRRTLLPGLVLMVVALALFARAPVDGVYVRDVLPVMLLLSLGIGTAFPSLMTLAMSGATKRDAGLASGLVNTTLQVGAALGLAVLATLSDTRTRDLTASGSGHLAALTGGYHLAFLIGAALVAAAFLVAVLVLESTEPPALEEPRAEPPESPGASVPEPVPSEPLPSEAA
jgi:MFS family permease